MSRFLVLLSCVAMLAFAFGLSGCTVQEITAPVEEDAGDGGDHADHDHGDADHDHGDADHDDADHDDADHDHADHDDADHDHGDADHDHDDHAGHDHGDMDNSAVEEAIAELPEADQAAARAQKTCPVTNQLLGSMGTPYKLTVNDKEVFLCCQQCEAEIKANPEKYLQ